MQGSAAQPLDPFDPLGPTRPTGTRRLLAWGLLASGIVSAPFVPMALPVLVLLPIIGVALLLPALREAGLTRTVTLGWIGVAGTIVVGLWLRPNSLPTFHGPRWITAMALLLFATILLALLWRWKRLHDDLEQARLQLQAQARESGRQVEAMERLWFEVEERATTQRELEQKIRRRSQELVLLGEICELYGRCEREDAALAPLAALTARLLPGYAGLLSLARTPDGPLRPVVDWGDIKRPESFYRKECHALAGGVPAHVARRHGAAHCPHDDSKNDRPTLCVPFAIGDATPGLLQLRRQEGDVSTADIRLAQAAAEQIGLLLTNLRLQERLRTQSVRDLLTGLYNRSYVEASLTREVRRAARSLQPVGLIRINVDGLERLNRSGGHEAGDRFLRDLADHLRGQIRGGDVPSRLDEDDFLLLLPEAPMQILTGRAEAIRSRAATLASQRDAPDGRPLTLSIGIASFPEHGISAEAVLRAADQALARAMEEGGDRVVTATSRAPGRRTAADDGAV